LTRNGWTEYPSKRGLERIFQIENQNGFFQADLPVSSKIQDYNLVMHLAVGEIAEAENRKPWLVIVDLINLSKKKTYLQ